VRILKGTQVLVAIATTLTVGAGLLWPGAMAGFVLPIFLLYFMCAIRAAFDHRLSIWFSFAMTFAIALFIGTLAFWRTFDISMHRQGFDGASTSIAVDAGGGIIELSNEALPEVRDAQARIDQQNRFHTGIFSLISLAAWLVVILSLIEWRWLSGRTLKKE
jgi:hypothetical protein